MGQCGVKNVAYKIIHKILLVLGMPGVMCSKNTAIHKVLLALREGILGSLGAKTVTYRVNYKVLPALREGILGLKWSKIIAYCTKS